MKVIIYCPYDFTLISGGIIALHKLADNLSRINGVQSYIYTPKKNPNYCGTKLTGSEHLKIMDADTIVVYPEVTPHNPLNAQKVVRWILNTPGVATATVENTWKPTDRYFLYDNLFTVRNLGQVIAMKLSVLEPFQNIFKVTNTGKREGCCHLIRKGAHKKQNWHPKDSFCIDALNGNFEEQAKVFNRCQTFISYDDHCFTTTQAALCGGLVIVVPNENVTPEKWYADLPTHKYGQSYGVTGIAHALDTQHLLKQFVSEQELQCQKEAEAFINFCKYWINE